MNEASKVGAGGKGKGAKASANAKGAAKPAGEGNARMNGLVGRMLVRAIWHQEWTLANPDAKGEARKAAWKEAREAVMDKNLKSYRRAVGSLVRSGVTISLDEGDATDEDGLDD